MHPNDRVIARRDCTLINYFANNYSIYVSISYATTGLITLFLCIKCFVTLHELLSNVFVFIL